MARMTAVLAALVLLAGMLPAQEQKAPATHTMTGYLVDRNCGQNMAKQGPEKAMAKAKKHTRECGLMEDCAASGYGLVSAGTFYPFDAAGNTKAHAYLEATKKEQDIAVAVTGTMDGGMMVVTSIADAPPAK